MSFEMPSPYPQLFEMNLNCVLTDRGDYLVLSHFSQCFVFRLRGSNFKLEERSSPINVKVIRFNSYFELEHWIRTIIC